MSSETKTVPVEHHEDHPILHDPYEEPDRHWLLRSGGSASEVIVDERRRASKLPGPTGDLPLLQMTDETPAATAGTPVDRLRREVAEWRQSGWNGATPDTRRLLEWWNRDAGEGPKLRPFYAQVEAVETLIHLAETPADRSPAGREIKEILNERAVPVPENGTDRTAVILGDGNVLMHREAVR